MTALVVALAILSRVLLPTPEVGKATWYGSVNSNPSWQYCYGGYKYTCSPFASRDDGGRGGELVRYCAIPKFRVYHDKPFMVRVTNVKNGRTSTCIVRDHCGCGGGGIIDLSPVVFLELSGRLSTGAIKVRVGRMAIDLWKH